MKKVCTAGRAFALLLALALVMTVLPVHAIVTSEDSPVLDKLFMQPAFEIKNWPVRISYYQSDP